MLTFLVGVRAIITTVVQGDPSGPSCIYVYIYVYIYNVYMYVLLS